uniref:Thaumatin-like protein n=1 Tax=Kalanchoe fedtschenkoi TaxID=63787 RepID=A0A7N1A1T8_KALFE
MLINDYKVTIWPAITPGTSFDGGGFTLKPGEAHLFTTDPVGWSGRPNGLHLRLQRQRRVPHQPLWLLPQMHPATLAEFTLASPDCTMSAWSTGSTCQMPMVIKPIDGNGSCSVAGCDSVQRPSCPSELSVKTGRRVVGCMSACDVFNTDEYCYRGVFKNSATCPKAYSYAYGGPSGIFTCTASDYVVVAFPAKTETFPIPIKIRTIS